MEELVLSVLENRSVDAAAAADLTTCDREPIHVPGAVQPHGVLLVVDPQSHRIVQVSENVADLLGRPSDELLQQDVRMLLGTASVGELLASLVLPRRGADAVTVRITVGGAPRDFDAIVHESQGLMLLELEPATLPDVALLDTFFSSVRRGLARVQDAATVAAVCDIVVEEFALLAGFDRTMAYRFHRDWTGEVVAEQRAPGMTPFLGLHYPATDVPRQARELYRRNVLRMIPDARYAPARIVPQHNPLTGAPLDLSVSVLRSVSPVHLEYLANMDVAATLTASLLKRGELWGMIAAHHRTPRFTPYRVRVACEMLARTASLHITAIEDHDELSQRLRLRALQPALLDAVSKDGGFTNAIASPQLLEVTDADGAAIKTEGEPILIGATPKLRHVRRILAWLEQRDASENGEPFVSDALALMNPDFADIAEEVSGLLAVPLMTTHGGWLLWFRRERRQTVAWGGDPRKDAGVEGARISPRRSFEAWKETVSMRARPWDDAQVDAAVELRRLLSDVMMRRAREYARLNAQLQRSNDELESFAHVASHDLKEPLRGLANYAAVLQDDYANRLGEDGAAVVGAMQSLAKRMAAQIDSMLQLAQVGADERTARATELDTALDEALALLGPRIAEEGAEIRRGPLPAALINPARAREIFINLIGNALKYNTSERKIVEIGANALARPAVSSSRTSNPAAGTPEVTIFVKDNGIGIRDKHRETIFRMFKRLHAGDRYGGGTGSGLAITRKIIEQNGGVIWVESVPDEGSTFLFTVPVPGV